MTSSILVVDTDDLNQKTVVQMLRAMKFDAFGIGDAKFAFRVLEAKPFKLIIVALTPEDPTAANIAIEAKLRQPFIKVAVVSGSPPSEGLSPYVDLFIPTPFSLHDLCQAVEDVIADGNVKPRPF